MGIPTTSSIEQTVTSLDGVVDGVGASIVANLPEAEAYLRHLKAIVELDVWDRHFCETECEVVWRGG